MYALCSLGACLWIKLTTGLRLNNEQTKLRSRLELRAIQIDFDFETQQPSWNKDKMPNSVNNHLYASKVMSCQVNTENIRALLGLYLMYEK